MLFNQARSRNHIIFQITVQFKILFYISFQIKKKQIKIVLDRVERDFRFFKDKDIQVIREYSTKAFQLNTCYTSTYKHVKQNL